MEEMVNDLDILDNKEGDETKGNDGDNSSALQIAKVLSYERPAIPNNLRLKDHSSNIIYLNNNIKNLLTPPTKVETILIDKSLLYVGTDGKLYFTPEALQYYVSKAVIPLGTPEDLLRPGVNPFGFHCIDGRVKIPDGFHMLDLADQVKVYPGTIPGGGAGMLLNILASLLNIYGEKEEIIKAITLSVLEKNKERNPDNYKIKWHTDTHHEKAHECEDDFLCGCGFIMKTQAEPEKYGLNKQMMDFFIEIMRNKDRSDEPDILGANHKHLKDHKERAAVIGAGVEDPSTMHHQNYIINKQVDFSPYLSPQELEDLTDDEKEELKQMAFTANFMSFAVKGSQMAHIMQEAIFEKDAFIEAITLNQNNINWLKKNRLFFSPYDKAMAGDALRAIFNRSLEYRIKKMTQIIKNKLSENSPLLHIENHKKPGSDHGFPVITQCEIIQ